MAESTTAGFKNGIEIYYNNTEEKEVEGFSFCNWACQGPWREGSKCMLLAFRGTIAV